MHAMSEGILATATRFWSTLYARDWDGLAAFFDATSLYYDVPTGASAAARGPKAIEARLRLGIEPLERYEHHLREMAANDDVVITEHQEDWYFPTGEIIELPFVSVQHIKDGVISLWKDYWDFGTLMNGAPDWWHERLAEADLWWVAAPEA
jgi:limonene-1,2-epoxide hydrolase